RLHDRGDHARPTRGRPRRPGDRDQRRGAVRTDRGRPCVARSPACRPPGRPVLTMIGTILGGGAFVAVLGLTATGAGQISRQFSVLEDTTVTVQDNGPANNVAPPGANPAIGFPADADAVAGHIKGVTAAGVWWPVFLPQGTNFTGSLALSAAASQTANLLAASPGAVASMGLSMVAFSALTSYE